MKLHAGCKEQANFGTLKNYVERSDDGDCYYYFMQLIRRCLIGSFISSKTVIKRNIFHLNAINRLQWTSNQFFT